MNFNGILNLGILTKGLTYCDKSNASLIATENFKSDYEVKFMIFGTNAMEKDLHGDHQKPSQKGRVVFC